MRKKTRELLAKARAKTASRLRVAPATVASREAIEARRKRHAKLKEIREIARSIGLPSGFYRYPTQAEVSEIKIAKAETLQRIADEITEKSLKAKIKSELKETSLSDMLLFAQYSK